MRGWRRRCSRVLRQGGAFPAMQAELAQGEVRPEAVIALHREARRVSPSYHVHMGRVAARHGREALAGRFAARAGEVIPVVDKG